MGTRGPLPARSDQKRRRNQPETPVEKIELEGAVAVPDPLDSWHAVAADWYRSLSESGQSRYFEPSDWQAARYCASVMSETLTGSPNAQMVAQVRGLMADLLTTEGARRRASLELERKLAGVEPQPTAGNVTQMAGRRARLTDAS